MALFAKTQQSPQVLSRFSDERAGKWFRKISRQVASPLAAESIVIQLSHLKASQVSKESLKAKIKAMAAESVPNHTLLNRVRNKLGRQTDLFWNISILACHVKPQLLEAQESEMKGQQSG